ncbi:MAG: helix-turn-helix transcriptional regulator [Candidatus Aminicenantes bacterium]|nr:helix-turn-helix transcriptional regulator [Candidatus Aminicenantes bacterium]
MKKSIYTKKYRLILQKLTRARKELGYTQEDVAKLLDKHQSYISKIEKGERRLDIIELMEFANIYKKSINYFID